MSNYLQRHNILAIQKTVFAESHTECYLFLQSQPTFPNNQNELFEVYWGQDNQHTSALCALETTLKLHSFKVFSKTLEKHTTFWVWLRSDDSFPVFPAGWPGTSPFWEILVHHISVIWWLSYNLFNLLWHMKIWHYTLIFILAYLIFKNIGPWFFYVQQWIQEGVVFLMFQAFLNILYIYSL